MSEWIHALIWGWLGKVMLTAVLPVVIAGTKQAIDTYTPIIVARVPKLVWPALLSILATAATQVSPEMFLLPSFPPWVSAMVYAVAAMGVRELYDQLRKALATEQDTLDDKAGLKPVGM